MLYEKYVCLVASNKQQIKGVKSKTLGDNSKTKATSKRVCTRPAYSASLVLSLQEDKNEEKERNDPSFFLYKIAFRGEFHLLLLQTFFDKFSLTGRRVIIPALKFKIVGLISGLIT